MILDVEHNIIHCFLLRLSLMNTLFINEFNQVLAMAFEHGLERSSLLWIVKIVTQIFGVKTSWPRRLSVQVAGSTFVFSKGALGF